MKSKDLQKYTVVILNIIAAILILSFAINDHSKISQEIESETEESGIKNKIADFLEKAEQIDVSAISPEDCLRTKYAKSKLCPKEAKVSADDITDIKLISDKYILGLVHSPRPLEFKLLRYNIETREIEEAKRDDLEDLLEYLGDKSPAESQENEYHLWSELPRNFGGYKKTVEHYSDNSIIELRGTYGDAGCGSESYYEYDVYKNFIKLVKSCTMCQNFEDWRCTEYY